MSVLWTKTKLKTIFKSKKKAATCQFFSNWKHIAAILIKKEPFSLFSFLHVRQESGYHAKKRQKGANLENELHTGAVGKPSKEGWTEATKTKHQSEEHAAHQSHLVGQQVCGIDNNWRERRGDDKAGAERADHGGWIRL